MQDTPSVIAVSDSISKIVLAGPIAVLLFMFLSGIYLFNTSWSKRELTSHDYVAIGVYFAFFLLFICGAYFFISRQETIPSESEVAKQFDSVGATYGKRTPTDVIAIAPGSRDWYAAIHARLNMRQSLRFVAKSRNITDNNDLGMKQYEELLITNNLLDKDSELRKEVDKFREATYYLEWFSDPPINKNFAWALQNASRLIQQVTQLQGK